MCQKLASTAGTSDYIPQIPWDVITFPCPDFGNYSLYIMSSLIRKLASFHDVSGSRWITFPSCYSSWRRITWAPFANIVSWWRHEMKTFFALLVLCSGNSPVTGEFSSQRPVTRSFDDFFDLPLNIQLSKQSWGGWFETPSCSLWRYCNVFDIGEGISNFPFGSLRYVATHPWPKFISGIVIPVLKLGHD